MLEKIFKRHPIFCKDKKKKENKMMSIKIRANEGAHELKSFRKEAEET